MLNNKIDDAKNVLEKCTLIPEAWIALGNIYSIKDESECTINSFKAGLSRYPANYLALLFIGVEYSKIGQMKLAISNIKEAKEIYDNDPIIYNELGNIYMKVNNYEDALKCMNEGISLCTNKKSVDYITFKENKAACLRKLMRLDEAIDEYNSIILLERNNFNVLSGIGYIYYMRKEYDLALKYLHDANFINSDCSFVRKIIDNCMNERYLVKPNR